MVLIYISIAIVIISLLLMLIGKILRKRKLFISGICIFLLLIIGVILFVIYAIEKEEEQMESQNIGQVRANVELPIPDRIIYKNYEKEYIIIDSEASQFAKIYSELYNRINNTQDGKVLSSEEIDTIKNRSSFIEFDYNTRSKNYIFTLNEQEVGIIKMMSESGQIIQTSLKDTSDLKKYMDKVTKNMTKYDFEKNQNYTSKIKINDISILENFEQKRVGIFQKIIKYEESDYKSILEKLNFVTDEVIPNVDFENKNVIITVSKYQINSIIENIGNIKYEFGTSYNDYEVSILIVSKIVNTNCIYYNLAQVSNSNEQLSNLVNITTNGIIKNITDNRIEIGLSKDYSNYIAIVDDKTLISNYETTENIKISDLQVGDLIYVSGETIDEINNKKGIKAIQIDIYSKEKAKLEITRFLKDTYRIDGMSILYSSTNSSGNGYIIVGCSYEKFIYPLILKVNNQTETFLGMSYHIKDNYGYVLYEMCDITLDKKITDIDNIEGLVKSIEYIAD